MKDWLFILSRLASTQCQLHIRQANSKMNRLVGIAVFLIVFLEIINAFPRNRAGKFLLALNFFGINFLSYLLILDSSYTLFNPCSEASKVVKVSENSYFLNNLSAILWQAKASFPTRDLEDFWKIDYHKCSKIYPYLVSNCHCWNVLPETKFKY